MGSYKSSRTHGTVENKIESSISRFSIFYDSMSSDCDLYHAPSFKKLKAEPFISVSLCLLLFAFDINGLRFLFDSVTCANYLFFSIYSV